MRSVATILLAFIMAFIFSGCVGKIIALPFKVTGEVIEAVVP